MKVGVSALPGLPGATSTRGKGKEMKKERKKLKNERKTKERKKENEGNEKEMVQVLFDLGKRMIIEHSAGMDK